MTFLEYLNDNVVYLDGGMGTLLQERGLKPGEHPERWNIEHPDAVADIHRCYYDAGSNVVCTNTFGANTLKFSLDELEAIVAAAMENARVARAASANPAPKFIALDVGPTGKLLKPLGDLDFEDAVAVFAETVRLGAKYGADLVMIETMNDSYETKAALLAAKENCTLPVMVSNAYSEGGKLMTGASPAAMVALAEGMGACAVGANCSLGPVQLRGVAEELLECASVPVILKPNAGLPKSVDGATVYDVAADEFAAEVARLVERGVRVVGGCCGTTPRYIAALAERTRGAAPVSIEPKNRTVVSSYTHAVTFGPDPVLIGERINPTGKKRFKQALLEHDMDYVLDEGFNQQDAGVQVLDVNVGLPSIDEPSFLREAVCELQAVIDLPLQIDTSDPRAMEAALRRYNGKALVNSVNGKRESMQAVFPLVKKYGGVVVALTLDEEGIPATAEGRVAIAKRILAEAAAFGIDKRDVVFDTLAMAVSADAEAANVSLEALRRIRSELGCHTSLGVSNVSFGLPARDAVNSTFFALALAQGLSAAIMNPYSADMMKVYHAYRALRGLDENCIGYLAAAPSFASAPATAPSGGGASAPSAEPASVATGALFPGEGASDLQTAIIKGLKDKAALAACSLLSRQAPLDIVQSEVIPALNVVGEGFERKTVYLPQLLMAAEAAKSAFEEIKRSLADAPQQAGDAAQGNAAASGAGPFVLATVRGDIHDIGKNIVKLLLENYGFNVIDLGKDVPPEAVLQAVERTHAPLAGLSALMTTTVPAMEETIRLLHESAPWCKVVVGGAVLTPDYAAAIRADHYAKDALETVRYAQEVAPA